MKRFVPSLVVWLLVASVFVVGRVQPVRAIGTIYIRADGSVYPALAPILRDGDLYTLTGNIMSDYDGIVIERGDMVLDGAGYVLQGAGGYTTGISLDGIVNATIKNLTVRSFSYGIFMSGNSANNQILSNNITDILGTAVTFYVDSVYCFLIANRLEDNWAGLEILFSHNHSVANNTIINSTHYGIRTNTTSAVNFTGNYVANSMFGIAITDSTCNNVTRNTVLGCSDSNIALAESANNTFLENTIADGVTGVKVTADSADNKFYHNSYLNNTFHAMTGPSGNSWNTSYPSGGNYWDDYAGNDYYSGPNQDVPSSDGIGDTPYEIDLENVDYYPLMKPSPWDEHDVALTMVQPSKSIVGEGQSMNVTVTVFNYGAHTESFVVSVHYNGLIDTHPIVLLSLESKTFTVVWNTTGVPLNNYTITATAETVPGETSLNDNTRAEGRVRVATTGDINGDGYVGIDDIFDVASHFGVEIENPEYSPVCDIIDDGYIGIDDLFAAASHFGEEEP